MESPRSLRLAAFAALVVTSLFWFWLSLGLLAVRWPNNGNGVLAVVVIAVGMTILGYGFLSTVLSLAARSHQTLAPPVLEGISLASLLVIGIFFASFFSHVSIYLGASPPAMPIDDIVFPMLGLIGSAVSAFLYDEVRRRDRATRGRLRPSVPEGAGTPV
jgi:hypothetical protein